MSQAVLDALAGTAPPLALADADGTLRWWSARFAALFSSPLLSGRPLRELLGTAAAAELARGEVEIDVSGDGGTKTAWRLRAGVGATGEFVISAEPLAESRALQAHAERLQERLDLVQELGGTGVFERDPATMRGSWDRHMYRIYGLPERPADAVGPSYAEVSAMILSDDRRTGAFRATLGRPGHHAQRIRIRRPDGQVRHLNTQWKVFHDAQGLAQRVLGINTDDTEVYELANRAEQLRTELDVALKLGGIALWRQDLTTGRLFLDARGAAVVGVPHSADGVTLEEARSHIHPDDLGPVLASFEHTLRTGEPSDMELRYAQPGGGWKTVLLRRALQRDMDGQPLGFVGVLLDVSERVEESRRLLDYARRLEAAAEAARIGLWSTQFDNALPSWNGRMYELLGLDPEGGPPMLDDLIGRCVHADDRARVREALVKWRRRGPGDIDLEFRIVRPGDGVVNWLVARGKVEVVGPGPSKRAEGVLIDVTEQHRTLRTLRDTVERMTLASRALGLGTWSSHAGRREMRWDEQMFNLRGVVSTGRLVPLPEISTYLHPDDREQARAGLDRRAFGGESQHSVFRVQWPDGQVRWITSHSVPAHDERGQPDGRIGVNWDSTAMQASADAVREREVAVAESRAKSQAMSRISHELRTPLNAVLGFAQLIRGAGEEIDAERLARWLAHIEDAGRHLLALIDDVLALSGAEVGELKLVREAVAFASVVDAALPLVAGQAQEQRVNLLRETIAGVVLADPVRLRQVLINLLSNAIKYNRPGGSVRLWTRQQGGMVALHVADTGIGIAPERLSHAFEPFNRLGAEASGVEGSGIGLALVKALVDAMQGQVEVRSELGQGTEFIVRLPAAPAQGATVLPAAATLDAGAAATPPQAGARVLYIEDNPVNALLVQEMLAHRPAITLEVAEDGRSGVQSARETLPDLILIDMQLPDIDGHAVLEALRADPRTAGLYCVALSANATPADLDAARIAGFADYWTKPIEFRRFLERMDDVLESIADRGR